MMDFHPILYTITHTIPPQTKSKLLGLLKERIEGQKRLTYLLFHPQFQSNSLLVIIHQVKCMCNLLGFVALEYV